jgi:anaerobic ribonucleoside-triphosphate reductase activating protein
MNVATLKKFDIANGLGVRVSLFVSGCAHHCPGCFNEVAWDFHYGTPYTAETEEEILRALSPSYIRGLSLLGGEPFEPSNQAGLLQLLRRVRAELPHKDVWCYTGFVFEELIGQMPSRARCAETDELLSYIDVLVDGKFIEAQKDISLRFRGSSNQRILDVPRSLAAGAPVPATLS